MIDLFLPEGQPAIDLLKDEPRIVIHVVHDPYRIGESKYFNQMMRSARQRFVAIWMSSDEFIPDDNWFERLSYILSYSVCPSIIYTDYRVMDECGNLKPHPLIDYQVGSFRDDFDFGPLLVFDKFAMSQVPRKARRNLRFSTLYAIRLWMTYHPKGKSLPCHIPEPLYTAVKRHSQKDASQFDYVDRANAERQKELEEVFIRFLKSTPFYLKKEPTEADFTGDFPVEMSVIIPVKNRCRTIGDAIHSALSQNTDFPFNVIVVDNYSTDSTTEVIAAIADEDSRVKLLIPRSRTLGIGGCWDLAVNSEHCGRFCVQLDSDDLYSDSDVLTRIHDKFIEEHAGMVVGSYRLCDFDLNTIPPGLIDHREWTPLEGHNNLLRVNGIGAPRAFATNVIRQVSIPNTSYGEDYAIALQISSQYRVGRIFDELYLCRRWEGNSDSNLDIARINANNFYKDFVRTVSCNQRECMFGA